ncbi:MAG TPA: hypothetical protein VF789_34930 [Thermoanaerobaculia bacterium]
MRLSALDCLRRGWANLSANWELVLLGWIGSFLTLALLALGVVLPLVILGVDLWGTGRREIEEALRRVADSASSLPLALTALLAVWLLTLLFHCFVQAGSYGVLAAADRQALPGPGRHKLLFRTFSLRDFMGWGGLYVWRFFRMLLLYWSLILLMGLTLLAWVIFLFVSGAKWGGGAALGLGCGGVLPLAFLALVLGLWFNVAQADLARETSGVRTASRRGLSILGHRLGAVLAIFIVFLGAMIALGIVFAPLSSMTERLLSGAPRVRTLVQLVLLLLQSLPNALLTMALAGSLVALVRSEMLSEIRKPEVQTA